MSLNNLEINIANLFGVTFGENKVGIHILFESSQTFLCAMLAAVQFYWTGL